MALKGLPMGSVGLITDADEVGSEFFDGIGSCARLYCLGIMCNEKGLLCLDDDNAFSSLEFVTRRS